MRARIPSLITGLFAYGALLFLGGWMLDRHEGVRSTVPTVVIPETMRLTVGEREMLNARVEPRSYRVDSADGLAALFEAHDFLWPPMGDQAVPPITVERLPPDLEKVPLAERKSLFLRIMLPLVLLENRAILRDRLHLRHAFVHEQIASGSYLARQVQRIAARYRVKGDINDPAVRQRLLRRVDVVPPALAMAQAANESAWGTSRFALEANNLFGQWIFGKGPGLIPEQRPEGASYRVRVFTDLRHSVQGYLQNINVGHAYGELRARRAAMRQAHESMNPLLLAMGLERYSTRGKEYVAEIQRMIAGNRLHRLQPMRLAAVDY